MTTKQKEKSTGTIILEELIEKRLDEIDKERSALFLEEYNLRDARDHLWLRIK